MPRDLTALFYPKSVAVVGASRTPTKLGAIVLKNIIGSEFKGTIYPVNPQADELEGLKVYPDVPSLPETPDLAMVSVPSGLVMEVLNQLGERGTKNIVVVAAGFKEMGEDGAKLEQELIDTAAKYEMNLLGPNCLGFVNTLCPINATFGQLVTGYGNLRFVSQSGAIASSLFDWCDSTGLGFGEFVTLGNKAVLHENHILQYFYDQSQNTLHNHVVDGLSDMSPVGLYLESISDGKEFLEIVDKITKNDPVLIIKPGKTQAAAKAMQSHTGAIAGEDSVLDAVLKQVGAIRCNTLEQFFDYSRAFAWEKLPNGPKVAIISNAGGPAVISADAVVENGLELSEFDDTTKSALLEKLPRAASIMNPVDVLGDALADRFSEAADILLQKDTVDSIVFILTPQVMTQIKQTAESISELSKKYQKPIFCSFMGGSLVAEGEQILNEHKIPSFRFPERAIAAIGAMWKYKKYKDARQDIDRTNCLPTFQDKGNTIREVIQEAVNKNYKTLDNILADRLLKSVDINTPPTKIVSSEADATLFAEAEGWPVVLKFSSPGLLHKRDVGGVMTDITSKEMLADAWHKLERKCEQLDERYREHLEIQIQKEVINGVELIVGVRHDPTFGPVLLLGAGGSYTELISDRNLHLLPLCLSDVEKLVKGSKIYKVLKGREGEPAYALDKLYELVLKLAKLSELVPEATDIEVNPVIVTINDAIAVDGKVILKEGAPKPPIAPQLRVATTTMHTNLATQFNHYRFETEEPLTFEPGQYLSVKVAPDAIRAYSIACHEGDTKFDLLVDTRPGGPGSKFFENLKEGDKMTFLGPFGLFTLKPDDGAETMLFMATGTGLSAVRCMIESALIEKKMTQQIRLYFGLTHVEEIFWRDWMDDLVAKYSNFKYEIAIFKPETKWEGYEGFITDLVKRDYPDASSCSAYLCGHRAMIADAKELLMANGCPEERIYTEKFI